MARIAICARATAAALYLPQRVSRCARAGRLRSPVRTICATATMEKSTCSVSVIWRRPIVTRLAVAAAPLSSVVLAAGEREGARARACVC